MIRINQCTDLPQLIYIIDVPMRVTSNEREQSIYVAMIVIVIQIGTVKTTVRSNF